VVAFVFSLGGFAAEAVMGSVAEAAAAAPNTVNLGAVIYPREQSYTESTGATGCSEMLLAIVRHTRREAPCLYGLLSG
jgi:hypothetical protein